SDADCAAPPIKLGCGSWAAAYRRAPPDRQAALHYLFKHQIVTKKEVEGERRVGEGHIEECIKIALLMLREEPADPQDFFQQELFNLWSQKAALQEVLEERLAASLRA
ncbi:unnamed protein product, partial [Cladocopium goreaui]